MPSKLDGAEDAIRTLVGDGSTSADIAAAYGVGETTVRRFRKKHGITAPARVVTPQEVGPTREEILEEQLRELKATVRVDRKAAVAEQRAIEALELAAGTVEPRTLDTAPATHPDAKHAQAVLLSDWHLGEVVDADQMNGLNAFNYEILCHRVAEVRNSLLSFQRHRPELTELHVWLLGDMCSGIIHDELTETNEYGFAEQAILAGYLIADLIADLVPHYPKIKVAGVCGNHPRTKRPHASKNVADNLDWVAYQMARAVLQDATSVEWTIASGPMLPVEIAGNTVLLWHGDGVRSSMPGVPWGGVMRRWNELRKSYQSRGVELRGLALGHFHQANAVSGGVYMNGSLIGPNEYGLKNFGSGEDPTQLLLTYNEKKSRLTDVAYITPGAGVG